MTSREFNQDTGRAKRAAEDGPVYITDRGRPAHVLLTYRQYECLVADARMLERLGEPAGVEDVDLPIIRFDEPPRPAEFS